MFDHYVDYDARYFNWAPDLKGALTFRIYDYGVAIDKYNLEDLDNPEFLPQLKVAFEKRQAIFGDDGERDQYSIPDDDEYATYHRHNPPYKFNLTNWLVDQQGETIDGNPGYLTLRVYDNLTMRMHNMKEPVLCQYIDYDWHKQEVEKVKNDALSNLNKIVQEQVSHGVSTGISLALKEGKETLDEIAKQKQTLAKEMARLNKLEEKVKEREAARANRQRQLDGYVYLLAAKHDPTLFKIGRTNSPEARGKTFNVKLPFAVSFDCIIKTDNMFVLESELHTRYADKRLDGEWFRLTPDDVVYIKSLAQESQ